ncbi:MAG: hypothetical protein ACYC5O_09340 [Anaerolineae bacterium]
MSTFADGFINSLPEELPEDLLGFVLGRVNSFVKWDVLRFLKENAGVADTYAGIARYVGRSPEVVASQLQEMAADGLLSVRLLNGQELYSLTDDTRTLDLIDRFHRGCHNRQFRLRVVYHVAKSMC